MSRRKKKAPKAAPPVEVIEESVEETEVESSDADADADADAEVAEAVEGESEAESDADADAESAEGNETEVAEGDDVELAENDEGEAGEEGEQSLDELVAALGDKDGDGAVDIADVAAALAGTGADDAKARAAAAGVELVSELPIDAEDDLSQVEGEASPRLMSIIESLLFAATSPLTVKKIRKVLKDPTAHQVQLALKQLILDGEERGVRVIQAAGGFVLRTNPANAQWVQELLQAKPVRLSRPQLESLAIVAYRQPVTKAELDDIRGVDTGAVLKLLLEKDLLKIVGKKEDAVGHPMLYGTTVFFLEFFNLMSLRDLPDLREFRELSDGTKERLSEKVGEEEAEALGQEVLDFARERDEEKAREAAAAAEAAELAGAEGEADAQEDDAGTEDGSDGESGEGEAEADEPSGEDAESEGEEGAQAHVEADEEGRASSDEEE